MQLTFTIPKKTCQVAGTKVSCRVLVFSLAGFAGLMVGAGNLGLET
jgi:hypothetical protein